MQPALIVVAQIASEGPAQRRLREKDNAARQLRLQRVKKGAPPFALSPGPRTLALCVDAVSRDERAEGRAHVLGAAIAVENQPAPSVCAAA